MSTSKNGSVLITGCDYGIGFEFARQFAADGWTVHAACLQPDSRARIEALPGAPVFHLLDVGDQSSMAALAQTLTGTSLDVLINNAATFAPDGPGALELPDLDEYTRVMRVNAAGPVYMAEAFAEHVAASDRKQMVFIGTRSGSIGDNNSGGHYAYRCSKAALNMAVKSISVDLGDRGVTAVVLHPGSVQTETRKKAQIGVEESVTGMRRVISDLTPAMTGQFLRYDGGTIEW